MGLSVAMRVRELDWARRASIVKGSWAWVGAVRRHGLWRGWDVGDMRLGRAGVWWNVGWVYEGLCACGSYGEDIARLRVRRLDRVKREVLFRLANVSKGSCNGKSWEGTDHDAQMEGSVYAINAFKTQQYAKFAVKEFTRKKTEAR